MSGTSKVSLNPAQYEDFYRELLRTNASDEELDWIDDAIIEAIDGSDSKDAKVCAQITVNLLSSTERHQPLAFALNTHLCACCSVGDLAGARKSLEHLVELTIQHDTVLAAVSAAENARRFLPGNALPDEVPHFLRTLVRLYEHLEMFEDAVETLITAAHLFADFGSFPTAYRSLHDAETLARTHQLPEPFCDVLGAMHGIALLEGDHEYANQVFEGLESMCKQLGKLIPAHSAINQATLLMQTEEYRLASKQFEAALTQLRPDDPKLPMVLVNQSACLRQLGDRLGSDKCMQSVRQQLEQLDLAKLDPEHLTEIELIAAKNAVASGDMAELAACLKRAVIHLDSAIQLVEKLHYRRGLRDRYIRRMENLLVEMPCTGSASDVVEIIASTRNNRLADWLHVLAWVNDISPSLTDTERENLEHLIFRLADHGAPHLLGFREKYDDPMANMDFIPDPWLQFAEISSSLSRQYCFRLPFDTATNGARKSIIEARLAEGYAIMINLFTAGHKAMILIGNRYELWDLPENETKEFFLALHAHRHEPNQSRNLNSAVINYQTALISALKSPLEQLTLPSCKGLIFLPDGMDLTPINLLAVGYPAIREKMANGEFEVRTCLALYPSNEIAGGISTCLGLIEADTNLKHDRAEIENFFERAGIQGSTLIDPSWDSFEGHMRKSDALVLARHGMSIGLFTDPTFSDMAGPHGSSVMCFAGIQSSAYRWHHKLVLLGACHSGGLVNRNSHQHFRSHDLMGFPSLFLVNGQCVVLGASWAIIDRFNMLLSAILAKKIHAETASRAASYSLALLASMTREALAELQAATLAHEIVEPSLLDRLDNLRNQAYCYGAYQLYTLL